MPWIVPYHPSHDTLVASFEADQGMTDGGPRSLRQSGSSALSLVFGKPSRHRVPLAWRIFPCFCKPVTAGRQPDSAQTPCISGCFGVRSACQALCVLSPCWRKSFVHRAGRSTNTVFGWTGCAICAKANFMSKQCLHASSERNCVLWGTLEAWGMSDSSEIGQTGRQCVCTDTMCSLCIRSWRAWYASVGVNAIRIGVDRENLSGCEGSHCCLVTADNKALPPQSATHKTGMTAYSRLSGGMSDSIALQFGEHEHAHHSSGNRVRPNTSRTPTRAPAKCATWEMLVP